MLNLRTLRHYIRHSPGCLKIEAAGDGIHVEHLACKVETWMLAGFEC